MKRALAVSLLSLAAAPLVAQCTLRFDAPRTSGTKVAPADRFLGLPNEIAATYKFPVPKATDYITADVNRDGIVDVLSVALVNPPRISAAIYKDDGTFTIKETPLPAAVLPVRSDSPFVLADFNNDGLIDVFVAGAPLFLGVGDGTFTPEASAPFPNSGSWLGADIDGDGHPDLISGPASGSGPYLFYRRETFGFAAGQQWPAHGVPRLAADFDRDGREDIAADGEIVFGNGTDAPVRAVKLPVGGTPVIAADFNGDGAPDLLLDEQSFTDPHGHLRVVVNDGRGHFEQRFAMANDLRHYAVGDIDGDGVLDLIVPFALEPAVLHGFGDGTFALPRVALPDTQGRLAVSGDFDGDGDDDIAMSGTIEWNNGDNTFHASPLSVAQPLLAADFDGDGAAEIVDASSPLIYVFSQRPGKPIVELARFTAANVRGAVAGNFTGGQHKELAVLTESSVLVFDVAGGGAAPRVTLPLSGVLLNIATTDLDADGRDDIIVTGYRGNSGFLSVFLSAGASFGAEKSTEVGGQTIRSTAAGDFNGDGRGDVVIAGINSAGDVVLTALYGDGSGGFTAQQRLGAGFPALVITITAADLDGDGITDVALDGPWRWALGSHSGLIDQPHYVVPPNHGIVPLLVRPRRNALPSFILAAQARGQDSYIYQPFCGRMRPVRR